MDGPFYWPKETITGRLTDRSRLSTDRGRLSVASNYSLSSSMDLTYRDYFGAPKYTPFDEKFNELHYIRAQAKLHTKKVNALKLHYMDWFTRKCQSFLDSLKLIQILAAKIIPPTINSMEDFKKVHDMSRRFPRNGTPRDNAPAKMDEFNMFWIEMCDLKETTDEIYDSLCKYCENVTRLRHPTFKTEIDRLKEKLDKAFKEDFDFSELKNEHDDLFVYKMAPFDHQFHGIMGYIPYLMTLTKRILAWIGKVHLEKE